MTSSEVDMSSNEYHFITHWRVAGTVKEVYDLISNPMDLVRWWPAVYLDVQERDDSSGAGTIYSLYTKGWLPYTLRWQFRITESQYPSTIALQAWGDFDGQGIWTFAQEGLWVNITYDWRIRAEKPLLRYGSFLLKPIFAANHRWAMRMGEQSLKLELARRHTASAAERARIPAPPQPTTISPVPLVVGITAVVIAGVGLGYRFARRLRCMPDQSV